jgi:ABC-type polar amino acid transport system ATPase subunit
VLHGVDLTVHAGEHVVIFGPSGSGKSTLLRTINMLEEPSEGSVRVHGVEYGPGFPDAKVQKRGDALELRRNVGMVFQQFNLFPHLTALHNIALALRTVRGIDRRESEDRAACTEAGGAAAAGPAVSRASSRAGSSSGSRSPGRLASTRR